MLHFFKNNVKRFSYHFFTSRERMRSVKQNLRLNNRRESGRLTFFCKRRETRRVFAQAFLCRKSIANPDYRPPFCEFRSEFYVFLKPRRKSIKPLGHLFLWRTGQWLVLNLVERLCLLVNFDAGKNAASFQKLCERRAVGGALSNGLVKAPQSPRSIPSVPNKSSRHLRRISGVFSIPYLSNRLAQVESLSSAAKIPLPGARSFFAMSCSAARIKKL